MTGQEAGVTGPRAGTAAPGADAESEALLHVRRLVAAVLDGAEVTDVRAVTAGASKSIEIIEVARDGAGASSDEDQATSSVSRASSDSSTYSASPVSRVVLRSDTAPEADPDGMLREAALLSGAAQRGVPVPRVLAAGRGGEDFPVPFVLTTFVPGETLAPRLLRAFAQQGGGEDFVRELGGHLARIHAMDVPALIDPAGTDVHAEWHARYRVLGVESAVFERAFQWLDENRPAEVSKTLVHGDFRLGNLMVDDGRVTGVLDWELAHVGDPREDLGWLCAPPWRFRSPQPVAGIGSREALLQGYREAGGLTLEPRDLHWFEVLSTVLWGVMCLGRGRDAAEGTDRRLEFALIGRRFAECEYDVLRQLGCDSIEERYREARQVVDEDAHDRDPVLEESLVESLGTSYEGRLQAAALRTLLREARAGDRLRADEHTALARAGHASEAALAESIRAGSPLTDDERTALEQIVSNRLALANPTYVTRGSARGPSTATAGAEMAGTAKSGAVTVGTVKTGTAMTERR